MGGGGGERGVSETPWYQNTMNPIYKGLNFKSFPEQDAPADPSIGV